MPIVNTLEMFSKAYHNKYAIGAFNVSNMEIIQGVTSACKELKSPVILQVSAKSRVYAGHTFLVKMAEASVIENNLPIALHLDNSTSFELCKSCIDCGFTSVMIDGSSLSYEDNVELTKKVVDYANPRNVSVEGKLGLYEGEEYTNVRIACDFIEKTKINSIAVDIGNINGINKLKNGNYELRIDILRSLKRQLNDMPMVLHGGSSIYDEEVDEFKKYGGKISDTYGYDEDILKEAVQSGICKINFNSDLQIAYTTAIRKYLFENPNDYNPENYLSFARDAVKKIVARKINNILGSNNIV